MYKLKRTHIYYLIAAGFGLALAFSNCAPTSDDKAFSQASAPAPIAPETSAPVIGQASGDPGFSTGFWVPPGMPNRTVADTSGFFDLRIVSYIPGCLNGLAANNSATGCAANSSFTGPLADSGKSHTFSFGTGRQLVLRLKPRPGAGAKIDALKLTSETGGAIRVSVRMWVSADPTASYESVSSQCRDLSVYGHPNPSVYTGPGHCPISDQIPIYYLGIEYDEASSERFQLEAGGQSQMDFY